MAKQKQESNEENQPHQVIKTDIPEINTRIFEVTIVGDSPLMVHRFSEKSKTEIEEKQTKVAKNVKGARDPRQEWEDAMYIMPSTKHLPIDQRIHAMPANGIKNAMVSAARYVDGLKMINLKGAFFVLAQEAGLVPIQGKPEFDESIVRIGNFGKKIATPRYRPRYDDWSCTFRIKYNANVIAPAQIVNLLQNAGFGVGLCEWRPEKNGSYGMFHVESSPQAA